MAARTERRAAPWWHWPSRGAMSMTSTAMLEEYLKGSRGSWRGGRWCAAGRGQIRAFRTLRAAFVLWVVAGQPRSRPSPRRDGWHAHHTPRVFPDAATQCAMPGTCGGRAPAPDGLAMLLSIYVTLSVREHRQHTSIPDRLVVAPKLRRIRVLAIILLCPRWHCLWAPSSGCWASFWTRHRRWHASDAAQLMIGLVALIGVIFCSPCCTSSISGFSDFSRSRLGSGALCGLHVVAQGTWLSPIHPPSWC